MQCERCNKKKATVFYRESIGGRVRALRLCEECAEALEQAGELEDMSIPLSGSLSPFLRGEEGFLSLPFHKVSPSDARGTAKKCALCGAGYAELAAGGKVGCPACYTVFSEELSKVILAAHGRVEHRGRLSAGFRAWRERLSRLEELRELLKQAVEAEEYERAAGLRDEIRGLEAAL